MSSYCRGPPAGLEELGWRGYLLPRLRNSYPYRKALLLHGLITWVWHWPVVVAMGLAQGGNPWVGVSLLLGISLIPTILHAVVFAYIWTRSGSLAVATVYHAAFDEVRDTLEDTTGLGALGQNWQMLVLTVLGLVLLWKAPWRERLRGGVITGLSNLEILNTLWRYLSEMPHL